MIDQAAQAVTNIELTNQIANLNVLIGQLAQFTSHVSTGAMTAQVIQWAKTRQSIAPLWSRLSDRAKVIAGMIAAAFPAAGIVFTFQHPGAGHYIFDFQNVTLFTAGAFVWSLLQNWIFQQGWYTTVIKAKAVTGVADKPGIAPPPPVVVEGVRP